MKIASVKTLILVGVLSFFVSVLGVKQVSAMVDFQLPVSIVSNKFIVDTSFLPSSLVSEQGYYGFYKSVFPSTSTPAGCGVGSGTGHLGDFDDSINTFSVSTCSDGTYWLSVQVPYTNPFYNFYAIATKSSGVWATSTVLVKTRILSVTPVASSSVSSTSPVTVGFTSFISLEDVGKRIDYTIFPVNTLCDLVQSGYDSILCDSLDQTLEWSVYSTTTGIMSWSTTTDSVLPVGSYSSSVKFRDWCVLGICFGILANSDGYLVATTSDWAVQTPSALGTAVSDLFQGVVDFSTGNSTTTLVSACSFSNWNASACLYGLFVPAESDIDIILKDGEKIFLFGYVARFVDILVNTATSSLPSISYTFGTSSVLYSTIGSISFDPFATLASSSNIVNSVSDQSTHKTIWQILETPVNIIVYLMLGLMILKDISGLRLYDKDSHYK